MRWGSLWGKGSPGCGSRGGSHPRWNRNKALVRHGPSILRNAYNRSVHAGLMEGRNVKVIEKTYKNIEHTLTNHTSLLKKE